MPPIATAGRTTSPACWLVWNRCNSLRRDDRVGVVAVDDAVGPDDDAVEARAGANDRAGADDHQRRELRARLDRGGRRDRADGAGWLRQGDGTGEQVPVALEVALGRRVLVPVAGVADGFDALAVEERGDVGLADRVRFSRRRQATDEARR